MGTRTAALAVSDSNGSTLLQVGQGTLMTRNFGMALISELGIGNSSTLYLPASGLLATDALWLTASSINTSADSTKTINRFTAAQGFTGDTINMDHVKPMDFPGHVDPGNWPDSVTVSYTPGPNSPPIGSIMLVGSTGENLPNFTTATITRQVMAKAGWLLGSNQIPIGSLYGLAGYNTAWNVVP